MKREKLFGAFCCFMAAFLWGVCFVVQDEGAKYMGPFTLQALRSFVGALALVPVFLVIDRNKKKKGVYTPPTKQSKKALLWGGILCGAILCLSACLQQFGIQNNDTSPGKDAFITVLYIVFVPLLSLFLGKKSKPHVYVSVGIALVGLWLLCMGGSSISKGDVQVILCALCFSVHIIVVDLVAPHVDGVRLSSLQFLVSGVISTVLMFLFETPDVSLILKGWWVILYAGVFSGGAAFTFQIVGQQHTSATVSSLIMSLESVVAVVSSMILLHMVPTAREFFGMALIFFAVIFSQLPLRYPLFRRKKSS